MLGKVRGAFDCDRVDVFRPVLAEVPNGDGSSFEELQNIAIYTGVPCHITCLIADFAAGQVDVKPTDAQYRITCAVGVDLQKGDYVKAYKYSGGEVVGGCRGFCKEPALFASRIEVALEMRLNT